jgi:hypothetical protein
MKTKSIIRTLLCALLSVGIVAPAVAGPGPHEVYMPVTTMKQAESIQPGTRIAIECPVCGGIKTMIADKDRNYLHGFTCDTCKTKFVVRTDAHGGSHGAYICEDDAGHKAKLLMAL